MHTQHLKVLMVDDNVDSAQSMGDLLDAWGHDARLAYDGPAALAEAEQFHPDVVLLDIGLPGMDGYEVARRLRRDYSPNRTLIVAVTGYSQPEHRREALAAGCDEHLIKPIDLDELKRLLEMHLTMPHP